MKTIGFIQKIVFVSLSNFSFLVKQRQSGLKQQMCAHGHQLDWILMGKNLLDILKNMSTVKEKIFKKVILHLNNHVMLLCG